MSAMTDDSKPEMLDQLERLRRKVETGEVIGLITGAVRSDGMFLGSVHGDRPGPHGILVFEKYLQDAKDLFLESNVSDYDGGPMLGAADNEESSAADQVSSAPRFTDQDRENLETVFTREIGERYQEVFRDLTTQFPDLQPSAIGDLALVQVIAKQMCGLFEVLASIKPSIKDTVFSAKGIPTDDTSRPDGESEDP